MSARAASQEPSGGAAFADQLLRAIERAQSRSIAGDDPRLLFEGLLQDLLELTASEYGFIGELLAADDGRPYLKTYAITNIAWSPETLAFYEDNVERGLEFFNFETLFGAALRSGAPVIANQPATDPRAGGLPAGHPALDRFLGVPFAKAGEVLGMVGIANRPVGYDEELVRALQPFLATCANLVSAYRSDRRRRAVEASLRERDARTSAVLASISDAVLTVDDGGAITSANPAVEALFRYPLGGLVGRELVSLLPEGRRAHGRELLERVRVSRDGRPEESWDLAGQRRDGVAFPVHVRLTRFGHGDENLTTCVIRDVTREQERARTARLAKFSVDRAAEAIFWIGPDARFVYVNEAACLSLQQPRDALQRMRLLDIDGTMTEARWLEYWQRLKDGGSMTLESVHRRRDGTEFPVEVSLNYVVVEGEEFSCAYARDITARKETERELRDSEQVKSAIIDVAMDCVVTIDHQGTVLEFNPAAERTFGFRREDVVGRHMAELIIPPEHRAAHEHGMRRYLQSRQAVVLDQRLELEALRADGSRFPVEICISAIDREDRPMFVAHVRDLTERKETESVLRAARDEAEKASRAKSIFLASMSHEIRTPLTAIIGYSDLVARPGVSPETQREWILLARQNAAYLASLVNDILDLSKIEAGEVDLQSGPTDVAALVAEVGSLFRPRAAEKMLDLRVEYATEVPRSVETDGVRLKQILVNLVSNAIKFTERGVVVVRLAVVTAGSGEAELAVDVEDTGIGILAERLGELFSPFVQLDAATGRVRGGTGLGLTISRHLARLLGGDITVASQRGKGSQFRLRLPLGEVGALDLVAADELTRTRVAHATGEVPSFGGVRLLVVDDNVDNRRILLFLLESTGAEVTSARNGREAVDRVHAAVRAGQPYDLVLMDMQMPVMDGYEATRRLREQGYSGQIVALTAYAMAADLQRSLDAGCDAYLAKPVIPEVLYREIQERAVGLESPAPPHAPAAGRPAPSGADLTSDPEFQSILAVYLEGLPAKADRIRAARAAGDMERVRVLAHQLKGTAPSYGCAALGQAAAACDQLMRTGASGEELEAAMETLLEQLERARLDAGRP